MTGTNNFRGRLALAAALGALALAGAREAHAGFTVQLDGASVAVSPGVFQYNYTATTAQDDQLNNGDFFRIYDFAGLIPGSVVPAGGFRGTQNESNPTPPPNVLLTHGDDPAVSNLVFTYIGANGGYPGPTTITGFSARSTLGDLATKDFAGRLTQAGTGEAKVDSVGDVAVPSAVPEPAGLISGAIGIGIAGLAYARRGRKA